MYFWSVSLVYQLSGQFLIFLVDQKIIWSTKNKFWYTKNKFGQPKKNLVDQKNIWYTKKNFGIPKRNLVNQKKNLVDQKNYLVDQKKIWYTKKKFGRPKKLEIDRTIGIPKRLTKRTWTPLKIWLNKSNPKAKGDKLFLNKANGLKV